MNTKRRDAQGNTFFFWFIRARWNSWSKFITALEPLNYITWVDFQTMTIDEYQCPISYFVRVVSRDTRAFLFSYLPSQQQFSLSQTIPDLSKLWISTWDVILSSAVLNWKREQSLPPVRKSPSRSCWMITQTDTTQAHLLSSLCRQTWSSASHTRWSTLSSMPMRPPQPRRCGLDHLESDGRL